MKTDQLSDFEAWLREYRDIHTEMPDFGARLTDKDRLADIDSALTYLAAYRESIAEQPSEEGETS